MHSEDLIKILICNPELTALGHGVADKHCKWHHSSVHPQQHAKDQRDLFLYLAEMENAAEWLSQFDKSDKINRDWTSYSLKRVYQRDGGVYLPSGVFACAALYAGITCRFIDTFPNAYFGLVLPKRRQCYTDAMQSSIWCV